MNTNYKMYFSKYVLINLPAQNLNPGSNTQAKPVYFDFEDSFKTSVNASPATSYKDMMKSLRNYVANQEVVIKESDLIILLIIMIQMHLKQQQKDIF
jgi:ABC-type phosphate/phosphonate transport system substrate-binding protein